MGYAWRAGQGRRRRLRRSASEDRRAVEKVGGLMPLDRKPSAPGPAAVAEGAGRAESLLRGTDEERWAAARNAFEVPDGLALLSEALSREHIPRVREAIFTALAKIGTPEAASAVLPHLRSDDAAQRTASLDALRARPAAAGRRGPRRRGD